MIHSTNKQGELMTIGRLQLLLLRAIASLVTNTSALVADDIVGALARDMSSLLTVIADNLVLAVAELVTRLLATVANNLTRAIASKVTGDQTLVTIAN